MNGGGSGPRPAAWLDGNIAYCEAAIRYMTKHPATDPEQAAQDKKDIASTRKWLAELQAEREEVSR